MEWVQLNGKNIHGNVNHWSVRRSSVSRMQGSTFFFFQKKKKIKNLCSALGKMSENPLSKIACDEKLSWFKISSQYRALDTMLVSRLNLSGIFTQDSPHCSSATKSKSSCQKWTLEPEDFTGRIIFMSMFNDISWVSKENKQECELSAQLVSIYAKRFSPGRWSFFGPGSERSAILLMKANHKENVGQSRRADWCRWRNRNIPTKSKR